MIAVQNIKQVSSTAAYTAGAQASLTADTLGFDYLTIYADIGVQTNLTAVPTVLKVQVSDVTNSTTYVDYTNFVTSQPFTNQNSSLTAYYLTANTSGTDTVAWMYDWRECPGRYARVLCTTGYAQSIGLKVLLSRPEQSPWTGGTNLTASTTFGTVIQPMIA